MFIRSQNKKILIGIGLNEEIGIDGCHGDGFIFQMPKEWYIMDQYTDNAYKLEYDWEAEMYEEELNRIELEKERQEKKTA